MDTAQPSAKRGHAYSEDELRCEPGRSVSLLCLKCPDVDVCGGLTTKRSALDCTQFCAACDVDKCENICARRADFADRVREVGGFSFDDLPKSHPIPVPKLPDFVPLIMHRSRRRLRLASDAVAIRLRDLFSWRTGLPKYGDRTELAEAFRVLESAALLIVGTSEDRPIEAYWGQARGHGFPEALLKLRPALVTTPNFSLFTNVPRWTDLHSMKRIAICWQEMVNAGVSASLHVNARTEKDWERWLRFVSEREEVVSISYEFGTGAANPARGAWHAEHLCKLARAVPRPMQLVVKGGSKHLSKLRSSYQHVVLCDATPFMKTVHRHRLHLGRDGDAKWGTAPTAKGEYLDSLLADNIATYARLIQA